VPEEKSQGDEPVITEIDSSVQKNENEVVSEKAGPAIADDGGEFEQLSQDIFENFGLCEQIVNDFRSGALLAGLTQEQKLSRDKVTSNLRIDMTLRRAEYCKFYNDLESSKQDFLAVIELCREFPEGNKRVMGSAFFNLG